MFLPTHIGRKWLGHYQQTVDILFASLLTKNDSQGEKKTDLKAKTPQSKRTTAHERMLEMDLIGGGSRIRTGDILLAKQTLYQLSYTPMRKLKSGKVEKLEREPFNLLTLQPFNFLMGV